MTKAEKLKELDNLVLDTMLSWLKTDETNRLPELGNAINYLKANNNVEAVKTSDADPVEVRKKKLEEAKKRRESNADTKR